MVELIYGSIFDSKCDMIVIPCNAMGGISQSLRRDLLAHELPGLNGSVIAREGIYFTESYSQFTTAPFVAYAASVDTSRTDSTSDLVRKCANRIKRYCYDQSLRKVNIPLLGTGAGHLAPQDSYKILKDVFQDDPWIHLCVYTPLEGTYDILSSQSAFVPAQTARSQQLKSPRVFISYTGTDQAHRKWVKSLATRLRENGVDARIDMFHLRPGHDLHQWMTNEVIMADKVLLICDKYYAEKADTRRSGVGWETMIILGDMLSAKEQTKYIGIIRDQNIEESLPVYIRSKYCLNWSDDAQMNLEFNDLLLYLFDCDIEPPLGNIPTFIQEKLH